MFLHSLRLIQALQREQSVSDLIIVLISLFSFPVTECCIVSCVCARVIDMYSCDKIVLLVPVLLCRLD